jgi:hypothetical protein
MSATERSETRALLNGELYLYASAVSEQARRLKSGAQPSAEWMADQRLFAQAVGAVFRLATTYVLLLDAGPERTELKEALRRFNALVPHAKDVRDTFEHLDDYLLGTGLKQRVGERYTQVYTRASSQVTIKVGPLELDVDQAENAVVDLASVAMIGRQV